MPSSRRYSRGPHLYRRGKYWYGRGSPLPRGGVALGTTDAAEAARRLPAVVAEWAGRVGRALPPAGHASLIECARAWLGAPHGYTRRTLQTHRERIAGIGRWLAAHGAERPEDITPELLDAWVTERSQTIARSTINRDLRSLKVCLRWATARGLCARVACVEDRPILREPKRSRRHVVPDPGEMRRILAALRPGIRSAVAVLYGVGLRYEELHRLAVGDLHDGAVWVRPEEGPAATAEPGKGYRERKVPVASEVAAEVTAFLRWRTGKRGASAHKNALHRALKRACREAGVPRCGLHDLRRAFATECSRAGVPLVVIAGWLGHRLVATTECYVATYRSDTVRQAPVPGGLRAESGAESTGPRESIRVLPTRRTGRDEEE